MLADDFTGPALDPDRWLDHYLPHWTTPQRSAARYRLGLTVLTPQPTRRLWTPSSGAVEVTVRASPDPTCMLGIWLVGFEQASPEQSGEICVAELFGSAARLDGTRTPRASSSTTGWCAPSSRRRTTRSS